MTKNLDKNLEFVQKIIARCIPSLYPRILSNHIVNDVSFVSGNNKGLILRVTRKLYSNESSTDGSKVVYAICRLLRKANLDFETDTTYTPNQYYQEVISDIQIFNVNTETELEILFRIARII